jgi:protein-S-isoprenylcysteine O-methyltransferase Ste14
MGLNKGKKYLIKTKLKIPPVIFFAPVILGGNIENLFFKKFELSNPFFIIIGLIIFFIGILIMIFSLKEFYSYDESPAPFMSTKKIITTGIFRFTRNPMYVSFFVSAFGISTILSNLGILLGAIIGIFFIHKIVVIEEEIKLQNINGYKKYKNKTRRWI